MPPLCRASTNAATTTPQIGRPRQTDSISATASPPGQAGLYGRACVSARTRRPPTRSCRERIASPARPSGYPPTRPSVVVDRAPRSRRGTTRRNGSPRGCGHRCVCGPHLHDSSPLSASLRSTIRHAASCRDRARARRADEGPASRPTQMAARRRVLATRGCARGVVVSYSAAKAKRCSNSRRHPRDRAFARHPTLEVHVQRRASSMCRIRRTTSTWSNGLVRKSVAPASSARSLASAESSPSYDDWEVSAESPPGTREDLEPRRRGAYAVEEHQAGRSYRAGQASRES